MINNEKVIFNMATMPSRVVALRDTIKTILPQADELHIYLNEFRQVPEFLHHPKITLYLSQDHLDDIGDVGKFYKVDGQKGYIFTVDDKILYPDDYVQQMVDTIERSHRKAVVSNHGRNFHTDRPSKSYYFDMARMFMYTLDQPLTFVHEVGTGVMAYHSDTLTAPLTWFPYSNMTDIYFSLECQKLGIPLIIHPHKKEWLKLGTKHSEGISIHAACNRKDHFQTKVINDFKWQIYTCPVDGEPEQVPAVSPSGSVNIDGLNCEVKIPCDNLAIVMPVFNQLHFTKKICESLLINTHNPFTLIVIDDASTDGTREFVQRYFSNTNVTIVYHQHHVNQGVNNSWNEGIRIALQLKARFIAIINNDLELTNKWDHPLVNDLRNQKTGIVSPLSSSGDKLPASWPRIQGKINPLGFDILGCCFAFRADLISKIGLIPSQLHHYYGDNWFSEFTKRAGLQVKYCNDSLVHHYWQQTTGKTDQKPILARDTSEWNKILNAPVIASEAKQPRHCERSEAISN